MIGCFIGVSNVGDGGGGGGVDVVDVVMYVVDVVCNVGDGIVGIDGGMDRCVVDTFGIGGVGCGGACVSVVDDFVDGVVDGAVIVHGNGVVVVYSIGSCHRVSDNVGLC